MKYAVVFSSLGFLCAFYVTDTTAFPMRVLFLSLALCWLGVGLAYEGVGGRIFGKRRDGRLRLWSLLFWPFHLLNFVLLSGFRRSGKENHFDRIDDNIFLGCQLRPRDEGELAAYNVRSVLDLTCEFTEPHFLRRLNYRSIPLLDTRAPTLEQLQDGTDFLLQSAASGPVYVHCALGHGRSALFVAAYLLQSGQSKTPEEAIALLHAQRPRVGLHPVQLALLERFARAANATVQE